MKGIALLVSSVFLVACAHTDKVPNQDLLGRYYLQGIMEMGSQLSLQKDGNFEAVVEYGSADGYAKGRWILEGQQLTLHPQNAKESAEPDISQFFDGMVLTVGNHCLAIEGSTGCYFKVPQRQALE
ncbi:MAG: hypothetical protein JWP42_649 [Pseudomonas sp.]|nr:hypothetical protein [Pseudomonas sp.]